MKTLLLGAVLAASMLSTAQAQPGLAAPKPSSPVTVSVDRVPAGGVQPQVVAGSDGTIHLAFLGGEPRRSDVMYARRDPGEQGFSAPLLVGQPGSAVASGGVRGVQMAVDPEGRVHLVWNGSGKRDHGAGEPLLYARSTDGGRTFEAPRDLMGSTWALDGGASVAAGADGTVHVVWHAAYREGDGGDAARGLFVATSEDGGKTFRGAERVEQAGTGCCACCALKTVIDPKGRLSILYRAAAGNSDRDMRLLYSSDVAGEYWATPVDPWRVDACPVTTCASAVVGERVLIAWETRGQVWVGEIDLATGALARRVSPPGGDRHRKHPSIAVDALGRVLLAWASADGFGAPGVVGWQVFDTELRPIEDAAGSNDGLPAWGTPGAVAREGGFTIFY
jgi:hypothetical protein